MRLCDVDAGRGELDISPVPFLWASPKEKVLFLDVDGMAEALGRFIDGCLGELLLKRMREEAEKLPVS
jgi:hypothetical protein